MLIFALPAPLRFFSKYFSRFILVLSYSSLFPLAAHAASDGHLGMGMLSATRQLTDNYTLFAGGGTLVENFKGEISTIGIIGKLNEAVSWSTSYFLYSARIKGEERHYDHRLRGSLMYKQELGKWRLSHRSRVEYRRGDVLDGFRYRPAFNLSHSLSVANITLRPYVEFEPFYDFRKHANTLSLYSAGTAIPVLKRTTLVVAYFRIDNHEDGTRTTGPQIMLNIQL